jgi:3-oxoacyl-[acyl-carrier-protein] synthase-3
LAWFEFEDRLQTVPIVKKLYDGSFTLSDYQALLFNLRQQVIDGSRWSTWDTIVRSHIVL